MQRRGGLDTIPTAAPGVLRVLKVQQSKPKPLFKFAQVYAVLMRIISCDFTKPLRMSLPRNGAAGPFILTE